MRLIIAPSGGGVAGLDALIVRSISRSVVTAYLLHRYRIEQHDAVA